MAGKKKKKSGKKSGRKGGKKKGEPEMTFKEAIIAYRIGLTEKQLEDWRFEEKGLEDQKQRNVERSERLLNEQHAYMKLLLRRSREQKREDAHQKPIDKQSVITTMMEKWETSKLEERKLQALYGEVAKVDKAIIQMQKELAVWQRYKDVGAAQHAKQIKLLEKELRDMQETYDEMKVLLEKDIVKTKAQTIEETEETLFNTKFRAAERAMATIDKQGRQEVLDNDWMKKELKLYQEEVDALQNEVEEMERHNLEIMSELFDCKVEDLLISKSFFMTQFHDGESLRDGGILEVDLANVSLVQRDKATGVAAKRPKSAVLAKVEQKVAALTARPPGSDSESETSDEEQLQLELVQQPADAVEEYGTATEQAMNDDEDDPFDNYYSFADEDMDEYLKLGPVELKMLSVSGFTMPIHIQDMSSKEELRARECNPAEWPVTQPMLKDMLSGRSQDPHEHR